MPDLSMSNTASNIFFISDFEWVRWKLSHQNPRSRRSLKIRKRVGKRIGSETMPPIVTTVAESPIAFIMFETLSPPI